MSTKRNSMWTCQGVQNSMYYIMSVRSKTWGEGPQKSECRKLCPKVWQLLKLDEHKRVHYIWIFGHISDFSKHLSKKALTLWIPVHCQVMILRQLLLSEVWNISLSSFLRSLDLKRWLKLSGDRRLDKQIFVFWNISKYPNIMDSLVLLFQFQELS